MTIPKYNAAANERNWDFDTSGELGSAIIYLTVLCPLIFISASFLEFFIALTGVTSLTGGIAPVWAVSRI